MELQQGGWTWFESPPSIAPARPACLGSRREARTVDSDLGRLVEAHRQIIIGPPGPDAPQQLRATITGSTVQLDWEAPPDGLPVVGAGGGDRP